MTDRLRLREQVEALLTAHAPHLEVWAYGSRVNGRSHDASDLDLVLRNVGLEPIPLASLSELINAYEQSTIPILVEIHDGARLPQSFHQEIERDYIVLQPAAR